ncbi:hypothetical protein H9W91_21180 [Streptomyces alfalfae]|uniref:hypothetical protein n=1 Tax=Streptomyces alfalfae TaxID=1642299 RepID=UPI001BAD6E57|nr:hypothetical protein [Streptomyces alfalfae]QUI33088.1 hypothetical protein H9W91_21180 [Streptomyces alfalfae]
MFRTTAPVRRRGAGHAPDPATAVPRLVRAAWRTASGPGRAYDPAEVHEDFLQEAADPYGVEFRRDLFAASGRRTSVELADAALRGLGPLDGDEAPEVVVVAYATPDFEHGELVAAYLKYHLPGEPLAFAVSDQGVLAPFTALRVGVEYARRGGLRRVLLVVVDQSSQPYEMPSSGRDAVAEDSAVALLLAWDGGQEASLGGFGLGPADRTAPPPGEVVRPLPGLPCTGVWAALLSGTPASGPAVLADLDESRGQAAYCTVDVEEWRADAGTR